MASSTEIFDLGRLALSAGEGKHLELRVDLPGIQLGGETYRAADGPLPMQLDVSRTTHGGYALRLRYDVELSGPCMRCLEDAGARFRVDAREVHQPGEQDEDLSSPYLHGDELDVRAWARDALVLDLPAQIVCSADCRGICAECGQNLNRDPEHRHEAAPDPRWSKLSELKLD